MVSSSRQRAVRIALREHREAAGLRLVDVTKALGWTVNKLHRFEVGETVPSPAEVTMIMRALDAPDEEVEYLAQLAEEGQQTRDWAVGLSGLPRHFAAFVDFEGEATGLTEVAVTNCPGLLQLPEYSRAVTRAAGVPERDIDRRVAFRMRRQDVLARAGSTLKYHALIHEAALHYRYGGASVTVAQLQHVLAACQRGQVAMQVIPFDAEYTPADGAYRIFELRGQPPLVHIEHPAGAEFIEAPWNVQALIDFTGKLTRVALSPTDSLRLIQNERDRLETW
jgi:hypothetical protein